MPTQRVAFNVQLEGRQVAGNAVFERIDPGQPVCVTLPNTYVSTDRPLVVAWQRRWSHKQQRSTIHIPPVPQYGAAGFR